MVPCGLHPIEVCGEKIELNIEVKLLSITLDSKLTFNTHIDNITNKCIGTLFQCKRAIAPTWGLSPKVCHWIHTAIIRPTLAYCYIVWIRAYKQPQQSHEVSHRNMHNYRTHRSQQTPSQN